MGFWDWILRRKKDDGWNVKSVRNVGDIKIATTEADFTGTRIIEIVAWNDTMAENLYDNIRRRLTEEEK